MINYHSPCVSLCELDETGAYCIGCNRTQEEIFSWLTYTEEERLEVLKNIEKRNDQRWIRVTATDNSKVRERRCSLRELSIRMVAARYRTGCKISRACANIYCTTDQREVCRFALLRGNTIVRWRQRKEQGIRSHKRIRRTVISNLWYVRFDRRKRT